MRNPTSLSPGVYFPIHSRWSNRYRPSQFFSRHCSSRYILCSSPLPLRPVHGSRIRHRRCLCTLIPSILRLHPPQHLNKNPLRYYVRWCKPNLFPTTFPWPSRNATPIFRLPRRLHPVKHSLLYRLTNFTRSCNYVPLYYLRSIRC